MGAPAILKGLRPAARIEFGFREIGMLRPVCKTCQSGANVAKDWYVNCEHEPYVGTRTIKTVTRRYEDGQDGERIVVGTDEQTVERPFPNLVKVSAAVIINSGLGVEKGRLKGYILPSELRCEAYPDGIADFCEFRDCFQQEGLVQYEHGRFCREGEAIAAYRAANGREAIEIHDGERRRDQIEAVRAKMRKVPAKA